MRTPALVACVLLAGCRAIIPQEVTTSGLLSLKYGMTYAEVEKIIGPPICLARTEDATLSAADKTLAHDLEMQCSPFRSPRPVPHDLVNAKLLTLSYAEPHHALFFEPDIYVTFESGRFSSLYIKLDGDGICCHLREANPFYWIGSRDYLYRLIGR